MKNSIANSIAAMFLILAVVLPLMLFAPLFAQTNVVAEPPVSQTPAALKPILDLLGGNGTWLTTIIAWVAAIGVALAPFSVWISHKLRDSLNKSAASADGDDDDYLRRLFSGKVYRFTAFLLRFVNIDLPTLADLERAIALQKEAAGKTTSPPHA